MRYSLILFLLVCAVCNANINSCLVGGVGANANNPGYFDEEVITRAQAHNSSNGAQFHQSTGVVISNPSASLTELTAVSEGQYANILVGMGIECIFTDTGGGGTATDGTYFVTAVDTGANPDTLQIDLAWQAAFVGDDVDIVIGGAIPDTEAGVQAAIDNPLKGDASSGSTVNIYIWDGGDGIDITTGIDVDSGGGTGDDRKTLIGVDISYDLLPEGSYCVFDPGVDDINDHIFNVTVENVSFYNISAKNPAGSAGTPISSEACFNVSGQHVMFVNCYAERGYYGYRSSGDDLGVHGCVAVNTVDTGISSTGHGGRFFYCKAFAGTVTGGTAIGILIANRGPSVQNCLVVDYDTGISSSGFYGSTISNCTVVHAGNIGINLNAEGWGFQVTNNLIIKLSDATTGIAKTGGDSFFEDYNVTDHLPADSGFNGLHDVDDLTFTNTDPLTNLSGDDYSLNGDGVIARANLINKGVPIFYTTSAFHNSTIGADVIFDVPTKAEVVDTATVMGITGTASEGGGGGAGGSHSKTGGKQ